MTIDLALADMPMTTRRNAASTTYRWGEVFAVEIFDSGLVGQFTWCGWDREAVEAFLLAKGLIVSH